MKKLLLLLLVVTGMQMAKAQTVIPKQDIHYNVNYHWGFIDVSIAKGVVTIESDGNSFNGTLDGTSIPWEGAIFCVSDTLKSNVSGGGTSFNQEVLYQSGWYRHPKVSQFRSAGYNPDDPATFKNIAGQGQYDASANSMEAVTVTSDMIGMYYYAHAVDFESLPEGAKINVDINGQYGRQLVITYNGKSTYTGNDSTYPTYDCTFEYSYDGKMSGYPVDCQISATDRIPVFLSASLPIGKVEMLYTD